MQINVIEGGSAALFNAVLFPEVAPETKAWISNQFQRGTSMLTDAGRQFMEQAQSLFSEMYDPRIMQRARSMMRAVGGIMHPNTIVPLTSVEELRMAKPIMQRYIMSCVSLRELYHKQLCDGYSDSYVDMDPKAVGEADYTWRRVMNGLVQDTVDDEGNASWKVSMFPDDLRPGDRELDLDEQSIIKNYVWPTIEEAIKAKMDLTDVFGGTLEI